MTKSIQNTRGPSNGTGLPAAASNLAGRHLHFVGIGGCGMSGLARLARRVGATCTGSDTAESLLIDAMRHDGFDIRLEQTAHSVPSECQMMVISAAIGQDHPEVSEASRRSIPILKYAQLLGQLMIGRTGVAVAGTHGKSTTASILAHTLLCGGLDPSFIIGATCRQIGGSSRSGKQSILVAEACEYDRSFHRLHPTHAVILNVEEDHMDIYGSIDAIVEAFAIFAKRIPSHGTLLINHELAHRMTITAGLDCQVQTIGYAPQADWRIELHESRPELELKIPNIDRGPDQSIKRSWVMLYQEEKHVAMWPAAIPGEHMAYNAAAAAVTAHRLGMSWPLISQAMASFQGLDRRMQLLTKQPVLGDHFHGQSQSLQAKPAPGITVVDDYGHHPTEIDTTLRALRRHHQPQRLICVFQPHQHSRTRFLMEQFAVSFSEADIVIVPHIYFVRDSEKERHAVSSRDLVDRLRQRGKQAMHLYPFQAITEQLLMISKPGDLVVTMGAGDVWRVAQDFLERLGGQKNDLNAATACGSKEDHSNGQHA